MPSPSTIYGPTVADPDPNEKFLSNQLESGMRISVILTISRGCRLDALLPVPRIYVLCIAGDAGLAPIPDLLTSQIGHNIKSFQESMKFNRKFILLISVVNNPDVWLY